ncbi:putative transposase, partial [Orientia tsutsugamushi str. UT144]
LQSNETGAWYPQPLYIQELQQLVNRLNVLIKHKTQETID